MCTVQASWYSQLSAEAVTMLFYSRQICQVPCVVQGVPRAASSSFRDCGLLQKDCSHVLPLGRLGTLVLGIVNIIVGLKWFPRPFCCIAPAAVPLRAVGGKSRSGWSQPLAAASPRPSGVPSPSCLVNACMVCHGQWVQ